MASYLGKLMLFDQHVNKEFLKNFVRSLEGLYPQTYDETEQLPRPYQRYLRPHNLRTKGEISFLTIAHGCGLAAGTGQNTSKDAHAVVVSLPFIITLSRTPAPTYPPRFARFRSTYATYGELGQYPLEAPELGLTQPVLAVPTESPTFYVVISHGPDPDNWRQIGFIYANFLTSYGNILGKGIDLLAEYGSAFGRKSVEGETIPEPQLPEEQEENGTMPDEETA